MMEHDDPIPTPGAQDVQRPFCRCGLPLGSVTDPEGTEWRTCQALWEQIETEGVLPSAEEIAEEVEAEEIDRGQAGAT
jgi:hypothetical protein